GAPDRDHAAFRGRAAGAAQPRRNDGTRARRAGRALTKERQRRTHMIDSLYIGATGMNAQQLNIDTVANNLANVNTSGFKRGRAEFADLVYRTVELPGAMNGARAAGRMGMGAAVSASGKMFGAGEIKKTGETYDLAVNGAGFFEVVMPDG